MLPAGETEFGGQAEQFKSAPFAPVYPALHAHEVKLAILPAGEAEFDGQARQLAGPTPALYWLILHGEHAPFVPAYPALHAHAVIAVLLGGDIEFAGHSKQCAMCINAENILGTEFQFQFQHRTARRVDVICPFHCIIIRA